ncbi:cobalt ECF transporter T component CbiQ [Moorena sp. SIO4A5]|uniref:cobalt ECF transporter T component CbiQ n=1 Tax=Moorena sp. SIO4A5 TaxID=2607838 RepID=UPI0013C79031|nr:cobalt ECF transporter T component CbiQ [Moorena sp. SIO4A5]NEO24795.1 cobalt ECF transporter T component CbiQ [Moorena sp. SIO4A5]
MKHGLDAYAHLDSPIHSWEPRAKLIALLTLIFAFSFVQHLIVLPGMVALTLIFYRVSRLPLSFLLNRLRYPGLFLLGITLLLPFTVGTTVIIQLGPIAVRQEGLLTLVLIATRFLCILTISVILFGTAPFLTNIKAMRSLGLPSLVADMTLLSYRYIEQFSNDLAKMKRAMQLRGFRGKGPKLSWQEFGRHPVAWLLESFARSYRNLRVLASLTGTLLVRSYQQSQQVYKAMILRGYSNTSKFMVSESSGVTIGSRTQSFSLPLPREKRMGSSINTAGFHHYIALGLTSLISIGFVIAEILLTEA